MAFFCKLRRSQEFLKFKTFLKFFGLEQALSDCKQCLVYKQAIEQAVEQFSICFTNALCDCK